MPIRNHKKANQLITYLLNKLGGTCDYMKILKLMYFIDFENYYRFEKPITDEEYYHQKFGPVANYTYSSIFAEGDTEEYYEDDKKNKKLTNPNTSIDPIFSIDEENTIDKILGMYGALSATQLSTLSHIDEPWMITTEGEKIKYEYVFHRDGEIEEDEDLFVFDIEKNQII
jgi:uncharacterized phage-associated protein